MRKETVDQLITFLEARKLWPITRASNALKMKALERVAKKHLEIFQDYEHYLEDLRADSSTEKSLERTEAALRELRKRTSSGSRLASAIAHSCKIGLCELDSMPGLASGLFYFQRTIPVKMH